MSLPRMPQARRWWRSDRVVAVAFLAEMLWAFFASVVWQVGVRGPAGETVADPRRAYAWLAGASLIAVVAAVIALDVRPGRDRFRNH